MLGITTYANTEGARNPQREVTAQTNDLDAALRLVGGLAAPASVGSRTYDEFDRINGAYFGGRLPTPLIVWALTPWGGCQGSTESDRSRPPLIVLHPALLGTGPKDNPWKVPRAWLGWRFAVDVLLHECIHVHINYVLGERGKGTSSHDCEAWIAEVTRLAPLLGLPPIAPGLSRTKRVPVPGETTKTGKPLTRVVRVTEGNLPRSVVAGFPDAARRHFGLAESYYPTVTRHEKLREGAA